MSTPAPSISSWTRLMRRRTAVVCMIFIALISLASIAGPSFTGYGYEQTSDLQFAFYSLWSVCIIRAEFANHLHF